MTEDCWNWPIIYFITHKAVPLNIWYYGGFGHIFSSIFLHFDNRVGRKPLPSTLRHVKDIYQTISLAKTLVDPIIYPEAHTKNLTLIKMRLHCD